MNCFVNFLSSMSLISWFHDWCLSSVSWSLSFSNRILYFWYFLKIIVITRFFEWSFFWISLLHNICILLISWNSSRISLFIIAKIFTSLNDFNIEYNHVVSVFRNAIISLIQLIIELILWSHDIFRTMLLSDYFIIFKHNFS